MRILLATNFYLPHRSGLVTYVENLGAELVERGHEVTVLCARHDTAAPERELHHGMQIIRTPVVAKPSKGVVSPKYLVEAWRQMKAHDVVAIQMPQLEATALCVMGKRLETPVVATYQCDVTLPPGKINAAIVRVLNANHTLAARLADRIVVLTLDYARNRPVLQQHLDKIIEVRPPVKPDVATEQAAREFRQRFSLGDLPTIGICARLSAEKGFERIILAFERVLQEHPTALLVHVGDTSTVPGESEYAVQIATRLGALSDKWISAGRLDDKDLIAFYRACDVTLLPSVNSTEAYGIVQVESMYNGTPVIASDLPGVRVPVTESGMGLIVPPQGEDPLAEAISTVLTDPAKFASSRVPIETLGSVERCASAYEAIFGELCD